MLELTKLNEIDTKLFDETTSCSGNHQYVFIHNKSRFDGHRDRILQE